MNASTVFRVLDDVVDALSKSPDATFDSTVHRDRCARKIVERLFADQSITIVEEPPF